MKSLRLAFALMSLGVAYASAQSGCQTGNAQIIYPVASTLSSQFTVTVQGDTGAPCGITAVRLYINDQPYRTSPDFTPHVGGGGWTFGVNLPDAGYYNLVGVSYNNQGYGWASPVDRVFIAPTDRTVYINSPANGSSNPQLVTFDVRTRWDNGNGPGPQYGTQVTYLRAYVDYQDVYDTLADRFTFQQTYPTGWHYFVAVAWNQNGDYIYNGSWFYVN